MGHEFSGVIEKVGSGVKNFAKGDSIVCPFTISCGECFYCIRGCSSRCDKCLLLGCPLLDGAQAEYVRIPLADSTVIKAPETIEASKLCLMADIFPTGYFAAHNGLGNLEPRIAQESVVVVIGCGPVGLCAVIAALEHKPKALLAVDGIESRLTTAKSLGAEPWNYQTQSSELAQRLKDLTDNRGADVIIEVVGHSSALEMGFQLLRPWGTISSVGVHNGEIPWTGNQAYGKNLTVKMGRCPVRSKIGMVFNSINRLTQRYRHFPRCTRPSREEAALAWVRSWFLEFKHDF